MIKAMLIAGAGGFVGTCGRYLVGKWCSGMFHGAFPMGTFMVNIIGCFLIGLFFGLLCNDTRRKCAVNHRLLWRFHNIFLFC